MPLTLIPGSQILDGTIADADVAADAAIANSKIAVATGSLVVGAANVGSELALTEGQIVRGNGTPAAAAWAPAAGSALVGDSTGKVNEIALGDGQLLIGVATSGTPTAAAMSDGATMTSGGVVTLTGLTTDSGKALAVMSPTTAEVAANKFLRADSTWQAVASFTCVDNEIPAGTIDNSNAAFTLANTPSAGSDHVYLNGLRQKPTDDYTIAGAVITFVDPPDTGSHILVDYRY